MSRKISGKITIFKMPGRLYNKKEKNTKEGGGRPERLRRPYAEGGRTGPRAGDPHLRPDWGTCAFEPPGGEPLGLLPPSGRRICNRAGRLGGGGDGGELPGDPGPRAASHLPRVPESRRAVEALRQTDERGLRLQHSAGSGGGDRRGRPPPALQIPFSLREVRIGAGTLPGVASDPAPRTVPMPVRRKTAPGGAITWRNGKLTAPQLTTNIVYTCGRAEKMANCPINA